jgi:starch phosphorylase
MRLWSSKPSHEFDLASFNSGDYYGAVEAKERCESITSVVRRCRLTLSNSL